MSEAMRINVRMLCAYMHVTTEELAKRAGINANHLKAVQAGRATMTADDVIALSDVAGIDVRQIETAKDKQ
jgi:plasmid maintenance system antidote protein VapI